MRHEAWPVEEVNIGWTKFSGSQIRVEIPTNTRILIIRCDRYAQPFETKSSLQIDAMKFPDKPEHYVESDFLQQQYKRVKHVRWTSVDS